MFDLVVDQRKPTSTSSKFHATTKLSAASVHKSNVMQANPWRMVLQFSNSTVNVKFSESWLIRDSTVVGVQKNPHLQWPD